MLWLTAAIGDAPTAVLACAGLVLGVWIMARGPRRAAGEAPAPAPAEPQTPAPVIVTPVPSAVEGTEATTFRQGAIHLMDEPQPPSEGGAGAEPGAEVAPEPEPEPAPAPPVSPMPEFPPTNFRQGRIRVGGLERGKPRDD